MLGAKNVISLDAIQSACSSWKGSFKEYVEKAQYENEGPVEGDRIELQVNEERNCRNKWRS